MNAVDAGLKVRVLIVDDEDLIARSVSELLNCYGFASSIVHNGSDALDFLEKNPDTDIILLDINLGSDCSGIELIPFIKEKNRCVQVIMLTSEEKLETGVECMLRGASDYMTKPFDEQAFLSKVPRALDRKKNAQLNDLYLGIMVHDMKNPLQGFMSSVELLRMSLDGELSDLQKKSFLQADFATNQMLLMVNNIAAVSRFENGTLSARREVFVLQKEVDSFLSLLASGAKMPGQAVLEISYYSDKDILVATDKNLFCRVLVNIVGIAMRFGDEDSPVRVGFAKEDGTKLHTTIAVRGAFIEESVRESIFNKFSSVQINPEQSGLKNYGLGLTFSKMAVLEMGGTIWITGDRKEPSTTFHIDLPCCDSNAHTAAS